MTRLGDWSVVVGHNDDQGLPTGRAEMIEIEDPDKRMVRWENFDGQVFRLVGKYPDHFKLGRRYYGFHQQETFVGSWTCDEFALAEAEAQRLGMALASDARWMATEWTDSFLQHFYEISALRTTKEGEK